MADAGSQQDQSFQVPYLTGQFHAPHHWIHLEHKTLRIMFLLLCSKSHQWFRCSVGFIFSLELSFNAAYIPYILDTLNSWWVHPVAICQK
jgi:hypothetical protein